MTATMTKRAAPGPGGHKGDCDCPICVEAAHDGTAPGFIVPPPAVTTAAPPAYFAWREAVARSRAARVEAARAAEAADRLANESLVAKDAFVAALFAGLPDAQREAVVQAHGLRVRVLRYADGGYVTDEVTAPANV